MILTDLQEILGADGLRRFLALFAGTDVTFPAARRGTFYDRLVRMFGDDVAGRLQERFAKEQLYVPLNTAEHRAQRDEEIRARLLSGESPASISRSYRYVTTLSERAVKRIRAGIAKHSVKEAA